MRTTNNYYSIITGGGKQDDAKLLTSLTEGIYSGQAMKAHTVRSLANLAGVSPATISLALRNSKRISTPMREKIKKLAADSDYTMNPVISKLLSQFRSKRGAAFLGTIGILYTSRESRDLRLPTVRKWIKSAKLRASELGYAVDEFILHEKGMSPIRLAGILASRAIKGLLLIGPFQNNRIPADLEIVWKETACVVIGERPAAPPLSCVLNNQFATAFEATKKLLSFGYKKPALCIHPDLDEVVEHRFLGGFLAAISGLPDGDQIPVFEFHATAAPQFEMWIRRWSPDAILTLHSEVKNWIARMKSTKRLKVALAHLDCTSELKGWMGMHQDNEHIGAAAVEMLLGQLYFNILGIPPFQQCMFLGSDWLEGKTAPVSKDSSNSQKEGSSTVKQKPTGTRTSDH